MAEGSNSIILKYRPDKLEQVLGQDAVAKSLAGIIKRKTAHAFLFSGGSGLGKTTLARIAAKELGCRAPFQEIDAATFSGIDAMRQIVQAIQYKPMNGGSIALIIDEAHGLSKQAWDSLLKTIEEPPDWLYIFFCTTELAKVPKAVVTRCAKYALKPVDVKELTELLDYIAKEEAILTVKDGEAIIDLCVEEANGSPREALSNLAICAEASSRKEAAELLKSAAGSKEAFDLAQALIKPGTSWDQVQGILAKMKEQNAESVRHVVRAYATTVILGAKSEKSAGAAMEVLDAFGAPFPHADGISPVVLACGRILLGSRV